MTSFTLETVIFESGERYPALICEDGMPHFHVTLWVSSKLRTRGKAKSTITNKISHVKKLLSWERIEGRDLYTEFKQGTFLTLDDIERLRSFLSVNIKKKQSKSKTQRQKVIELGRAKVANNTVEGNGKSHQYNTLTSVTEYLVFLAELATQFNATSASNSNISRMKKLLLASRPKGKSNRTISTNRSLIVPNGLIKEFMEVANHNNPKNPFKNEGVRYRNHLMFLLLQHLGIRRGELLSLRLDKMVLTGQNKHIWIYRSHDDPFDSRKDQPVAKTKERFLAINSHIAEEISNYVKKYRSKIPPSRRHPYLFITHKPGETYGNPLSSSSFDNTVIPAIKGVDDRFSVIYTHYFRHDWNERLSDMIDIRNGSVDKDSERISAGTEAKMRKHQMGHSRESSGNIYNQRHVERKANELIIEEQKMGITKKTGIER